MPGTKQDVQEAEAAPAEPATELPTKPAAAVAVTTWDDVRYVCPACNAYMYFCSHCRSCGNAVCKNCILPAPQRWLESQHVQKYERMPQHVAEMKVCPDCSTKCKKSEQAGLWEHVMLPELLHYGVAHAEWCQQMATRASDTPIWKACAALCRRHDELFDDFSAMFLCLPDDEQRQRQLSKLDHDILASEPQLTALDMLHRTPKYARSCGTVAVDFAPHIFASILATERHQLTVCCFLQLYPSFVATIFPYMHYINQEAAKPHLSPCNACILSQQGHDVGPHSKQNMVNATHDSMMTMHTLLCLEQTDEWHQRGCANLLSSKTGIVVRNKYHRLCGLKFWADATNDSNIGANLAVPCVEVTTSSKRQFMLHFGGERFDNTLLRTAAFINDGMFGGHFRKLYMLPDSTTCFVVDSRDSTRFNRFTIDDATAESVEVWNLILSILQHNAEKNRRIDVANCQFTVDRNKNLVLFALAWKKVGEPHDGEPQDGELQDGEPHNETNKTNADPEDGIERDVGADANANVGADADTTSDAAEPTPLPVEHAYTDLFQHRREQLFWICRLLMPRHVAMAVDFPPALNHDKCIDIARELETAM